MWFYYNYALKIKNKIVIDVELKKSLGIEQGFYTIKCQWFAKECTIKMHWKSERERERVVRQQSFI